MKKIIIILLAFLAFTSYGQADFEKIAIHENVETASTSKIVSQQPGTGELNYINATALPISTPTQNALDMKLNISDLPANLTLYATNATSDIPGYTKMVTSINDPDYNTVAVDVSTPTITTTAQLVSQRVSAPGVLVGQPGVFNITNFGNIRRLSGTGTATFYFEVYHRDLAGVETLICTSGISAVVSLPTYVEFTASGIWDDGDFLPTDRIVIKTYANRIPGNSDPVYQIQYGGVSPVRTLLPVPFSVVDAGYELKANKSTTLTPSDTLYPTNNAVLAVLPKTYTTTVYVNTNDPNIATIFDDENPPTVNDDGLKSNTDNLYIGLDASAWVYSGGEYVTKIIPASSNFYIYSTSIDAGNNKSSTIERFGEIVSKSGNIVRRDGSDSVGGGGYFSFYNNAITSGNTFQLNASNGVDLWNYSSGIWNKRFTFSSGGGITATSAAFSSTVTAQTFVGALTGNASSATSWNGNIFVDEDNGNSNYILTTTGGTNVWKYRPIGFFRNDLGLGTNAYTSTAYAPLASPALTGTPTAPTAPVGTTGNQIATLDYAKSIAVEKISTAKTLANSDNGKVILLTASCTVTLPNGLMNGFNCSFATQAGATLTYSLGGSVVLINNSGTTMGELSSHTIVNTGVSNEYLTVGL